jgi:hypothetical protein
MTRVQMVFIRMDKGKSILEAYRQYVVKGCQYFPSSSWIAYEFLVEIHSAKYSSRDSTF